MDYYVYINFHNSIMYDRIGGWPLSDIVIIDIRQSTHVNILNWIWPFNMNQILVILFI